MKVFKYKLKNADHNAWFYIEAKSELDSVVRLELLSILPSSFYEYSGVVTKLLTVQEAKELNKEVSEKCSKVS